MKFEDAIRKIKYGSKITNKTWRDKGSYVFMYDNDCLSFPPFLVIKSLNGKCIPWNISNEDVFSDDWEELNCR